MSNEGLDVSCLCFSVVRAKVPLLIVSAGISDVIAEILRARELLLSNITIFANTMEFDEDGRLRRFKESPPVHSRYVTRTVRNVGSPHARRCSP